LLTRQVYVASVPDGRNPVEWVGRQAIVRLPDNIDLFNAGSLGEDLLALTGRGAAALIVDMTATASCDHAAAEALVRACRPAVASGAQLRLVAPAEVIRRVLRLNGLDRLVSVYPSREAALAARLPAGQAAAAAGLPQASQDLLGGIVGNLFHAGLSLQAALDTAHEADRQHIMDALHYLDQTIRDIRDHVFVTGGRQSPPPAEPPDGAQ
jgi:anti-sigma B factor antagonist